MKSYTGKEELKKKIKKAYAKFIVEFDTISELEKAHVINPGFCVPIC